jgi:prepilin-type N-terminal cleavage/methylation domain-containing protein/prepilin-type processing-associated H-X9-DG protein
MISNVNSISRWRFVRTGSTLSDGFTLLELLVVIAIIGVLVALVLPAVQMARESSRRSSCTNNLKHLGAAVLLHENTHGSLPTGGWGADWIGDPDAGFGPKQPGGWLYNILPYVEQQNLRAIGRGAIGNAKRQAMTSLLESPLTVAHCPSRRSAELFDYTGPAELKNAGPPSLVAKTDYAVSPTVSSERSEEILSNIVLGKGASNTVTAGEKCIPANKYETGDAPGDRLTMYNGDCEDVRRAVSHKSSSDESGGSGFGGPHPSGCNFVYLDGSVRFINEDASPEQHVEAASADR